VGRSECVVHLFTTEVTSDQALGNWYHFIKPIHCIKNLLTVKWLLNVVFYFIIISLSGLCKPLFYRAGQGALGMSLWNQVGQWSKKV
jgi:hypothetical protein